MDKLPDQILLGLVARFVHLVQQDRLNAIIGRVATRPKRVGKTDLEAKVESEEGRLGCRRQIEEHDNRPTKQQQLSWYPGHTEQRRAEPVTKPDQQRNVLELITNKRIVEEVISGLAGERAVLSKLEEAVSDDVGELLQEDAGRIRRNSPSVLLAGSTS